MTKYIKLERIVFTSLPLIGFYFCFDFGRLLTGDYGLPQLIGIPFAVVLTILCFATILTKNRSKKTFKILTIGYLLTIVLFVLIVGLINKNGYADDYYLYYPQRKALDILLWTLGGGALIMLTIISRYYKSDNTNDS